MPISPERVDPLVLVLSPDGQQVVGIGPDEKAYFYPVAGGDPRAVPGIEPGEQPIQWSADGKAIYLYKPGGLPANVYRLDLSTGHRTLWKELMPSDSAGVSRIGPILITPDGQVKLADLGLIKDLEASNRLTRSSTGLGTFEYSAPEQYDDAKHADPRSVPAIC